MKSAPTKSNSRGKMAAADLPKTPPALSEEERFEFLRTAAYYKASARQFVPGYELQDWLAAAEEFDTRT